ncbi:MAG: hypothetical protein JOS17DRAFT_791876 [Linnemannia elongata]|nr:MAG: hypothetical protein JOS17DRAFT_791876 [Linnemannia elongata]
MLPQNLILFITLWSFAAASPIPSVMINSHGTIINETGENSTNNQNGFNEDSFDEANVGLRGGFVGGGAVPVPLQGAAPVPVALPGRPSFVAVPNAAPAFIAVPHRGAAPASLTRAGRTGLLNGHTGLLNDAHQGAADEIQD